MNTKISVAVLGNAATGEHMLIELDRDGYPFCAAAMWKARVKQLEFVGVMGFMDGQAGAKCQPGESCLRIMCAAVPAFTAYLAERLKPVSDNAEWLEKLYQRPDTRESK